MLLTYRSDDMNVVYILIQPGIIYILYLNVIFFFLSKQKIEVYIYIENRKHNIKYIFQQGNNKTIITMASTTKISLEEHFRQVADVKELLSLAGLPMRATAVDALLQLAAQGVSAEGLLEALNYLKDKKIAATLGSEYS